jgi:hypothetical protein
MKVAGFTTSGIRRGRVTEATRICKVQVSLVSVVRGLYEASSQTESAAARINIVD